MARHKFSVGQVVDFVELRLSTPRIGRYEITRLLPSDGIQFQYRIKSIGESVERIATEAQLSRPPSDNEC
jgi:hypothetical protein